MQPSPDAATPNAPSLKSESLKTVSPNPTRRSFRWARLPNSLTSRLVLALFALMVTASACQIFTTVYVWNWFNRNALVELYRPTANEIARQIEQQLYSGMTEAELTQLLFKFSSVSPELDPFLLSSDGSVVGSLHSGRLYIDSMKPIHRFLEQRGDDSTPIWGEHPRFHTPSLFSAAPIKLPSGPGYVYVLVGSGGAQTIRQAIGDTSITLVSVLFGAFTLLSTTLLGILVFRQITRRYRENARTMHQFESGNYAVRLDESGTTEVAAHARAFNRMAEKILTTINQLERIDASRRALVAAITHDLRRPLTNIHLAVQRIEMRAARAGDTNTVTLADEAKAGCDNLERLIEDLFQLSRLDAGEKLQSATVELNKVFEEVIASLRPTAEGLGVLMHCQLSESKLEVNADEDKLKRLLGNLAENAVLYSGSGSVLTLSARLNNDRVEVCVQDTGRGIPADELPSLFDWFYRGESGVAERPSGTGLGLAICKRIAELHGSSLTVESTLGSGTTFRFSLPHRIPSN